MYPVECDRVRYGPAGPDPRRNQWRDWWFGIFAWEYGGYVASQRRPRGEIQFAYASILVFVGLLVDSMGGS